jgi:hypothetical protein
VKEKAIRFGVDGALAGVITLPETRDARLPTVLISNTGINHRVGPNRLHVQLARAFAHVGHVALRFDMSGMGDSAPTPRGREADSVADQRAALDALDTLGCGPRYAVVGICSGGHDAHRLTVADPRIVAGAFVDHYAYPTARFRLIYWKDRLLDLRRVRTYLAERFTRHASDEKARFDANQEQYFIAPDAKDFAADVERFRSRKVSLFFLFTGEVQNEYNYRDQLLDAIPGLRSYPGLALHHLPLADHTFTTASMRAELIQLLSGWLKTPGPAAVEPTPPALRTG